MTDVVNFAQRLVLAPFAGEVSSNYAIWGTTEVSELQIKYDCLAVQ